MKFFSNSNGLRYTLSSILLLAWLAQGISLRPFSSEAIDSAARNMQSFANQNKESIESLNKNGVAKVEVSKVEENVKNELQSMRAAQMMIVLLGIGAAVMVFLGIKFWRIAVVATSIAYLFLWYSSGTTAHVSFVEAYRLKMMMAETLGTTGYFVWRDVALPILLVIAIVVAIAQPIARLARAR